MAQSLRSFLLVSAIALTFPLSASAHMEMKWPYAFRSKYNPAIADPDYDNTDPLLASGSNYPCKGYQDLPSSQTPVVTYAPGQDYNLTLAGTATHGGGSCQISLSYDDGKSFHVIKSLIGGCSLQDTWDFTIPSYAPPSESVILAWTWFNLIGNREMYMSCARVAVAGQTVQRYRRTTSKRQASIDDLPENFACNIGNGCVTLEDHEVIFPNPGNIIERNSDLSPPLAGPGFTLTATPTGDAFSTVAASTAASVTSMSTSTLYSNGTTSYTETTGTGTGTPFMTSTVLTLTSRNSSTFTLSTTTAATSMTAGGFYSVTTTTTAATTTPLATFTTSYAASSPTASSDAACVPGTFMCDSTSTYSQCVSTGNTSSAYMFIGSVAAGMQCVNGALIRDNDGPCTPAGSLQCTDASTFYMCTSGGLIDMGEMAAGMTCQNGLVVVVS